MGARIHQFLPPRLGSTLCVILYEEKIDFIHTSYHNIEIDSYFRHFPFASCWSESLLKLPDYGQISPFLVYLNNVANTTLSVGNFKKHFFNILNLPEVSGISARYLVPETVQ